MVARLDSCLVFGLFSCYLVSRCWCCLFGLFVSVVSFRFEIFIGCRFNVVVVLLSVFGFVVGL